MAPHRIPTVEKVSKALGDANRLKILQYISQSEGLGQCSEIQSFIDLAQPSISHHIKILLEAGLIVQKKKGRNHYYSLNEGTLDNYASFLKQLTV
ncbi:MAG: winged helix-turn-helix transcriptional regulator [Bacteroidetes bacterium]|nr:winged helix-turn-helix transcriptional regulator [Bacteroidota bacterium]